MVQKILPIIVLAALLGSAPVSAKTLTERAHEAVDTISEAAKVCSKANKPELCNTDFSELTSKVREAGREVANLVVAYWTNREQHAEEAKARIERILDALPDQIKELTDKYGKK